MIVIWLNKEDTYKVNNDNDVFFHAINLIRMNSQMLKLSNRALRMKLIQITSADVDSISRFFSVLKNAVYAEMIREIIAIIWKRQNLMLEHMNNLCGIHVLKISRGRLSRYLIHRRLINYNNIWFFGW